MNYTDAGFRAVYHNFVVVSINESVEALLKRLPGGDEANGILAYGYHDRDGGITLEVLGAAIVGPDGFRYAEGTEESMKLRIRTVEDEDLLICSDQDGRLSEAFADKLKALSVYDVPEEVEQTRDMEFLDPGRHERFIDDVLVLFMKEGMENEEIWVRVTGHTDETIIGYLIDEPFHDIGYHQGDTVSFRVYQNDEGNAYVYYVDLDEEAPEQEAPEEEPQEQPGRPKKAPAAKRKKKEET